MKLTKLAVVLLLGTLLVNGVACGAGSNLAVPTVNYVPDGWEFHLEYHSKYSDLAALCYKKWGDGYVISNLDIYWESVPTTIKIKEAQGKPIEEAVLDYAERILRDTECTAKESGFTTVCGHPAVYTECKDYFELTDSDWTFKDFYFIEEDTFFTISFNHPNASIESESMALISSITFD